MFEGVDMFIALLSGAVDVPATGELEQSVVMEIQSETVSGSVHCGTDWGTDWTFLWY